MKPACPGPRRSRGRGGAAAKSRPRPAGTSRARSPALQPAPALIGARLRPPAAHLPLRANPGRQNWGCRGRRGGAGRPTAKPPSPPRSARRASRSRRQPSRAPAPLGAASGPRAFMQPLRAGPPADPAPLGLPPSTLSVRAPGRERAGTRAAPPRQDVLLQVQLRVAVAVPGAGRLGRAGHQHQSAALRGAVEAALREAVGQVVPAVSGPRALPGAQLGVRGPQNPSRLSVPVRLCDLGLAPSHTALTPHPTLAQDVARRGQGEPGREHGCGGWG